MISVLVVDDEPEVAEISRIFLENKGNMKVSTATSVGEALDMLKQREFDVVVSDYEMPGMNGIDLIRSLNKMDRDVPIIIFTGRGSEEIAIEALNSGVSLYLKKGSDPRTQFEALRNKILEFAQRKWVEKLLKERGPMLQRKFFSYPTRTGISTKEYEADSHNQKKTVIDSWNEQGYHLTKEGKYEEAIRIFDGVLEADPNNLPALVNKGCCLGRLGQQREEIVLYQRALEIDQNLSIAWYNKGIAYFQIGNIDCAGNSLARSIQINPDMVMLFQNLESGGKETRNLLITGVGGASGQVLAKFFKTRTTHHIIGVDANPNATGQIFCEKFFVVPYASDPSFIQVIRDLSINHKVSALFSTVDEELPVVAKNRDLLGCRVLLSDLNPIETCLDKLTCMRTLSEAGIPVADTMEVTDRNYDDLAVRLGEPFIMKPRTGRGSRGVHIIHSSREFDSIFKLHQYERGMIAQEYLAGTEYTIDVLLDARGKYAISVPRERILTDSGISTVGKTVQDRELQQIAKNACETLHLAYIVNVQACRDRSGNPKIIEVNPRPSGSLSLSIASSVGMPQIALDFSEGIEIENISPIIFIPGMTMYRYLEESFQQG